MQQIKELHHDVLPIPCPQDFATIDIIAPFIFMTNFGAKAFLQDVAKAYVSAWGKVSFCSQDILFCLFY